MPEQPQPDWSAHRAFADIAAVQTAVGWILMDDFGRAADALSELSDDMLALVGAHLGMLQELGDEILVERGFSGFDTPANEIRAYDPREEWKESDDGR